MKTKKRSFRIVNNRTNGQMRDKCPSFVCPEWDRQMDNPIRCPFVLSPDELMRQLSVSIVFK